MATSLESSFDSWLSSKLRSLNTDEGVFGSYITGILTGDESLEEKAEALEGIMSEITENDINAHCREIMEKWGESHCPASEEETKPLEDVDEKLVRLLEANKLSTTVQREYTEEERKIREAILSQYSEVQISDQEDGDGEDVEESVVKNTNVSSVVQAEKEKREKAKVDSQKKKEKDREDRERQKKEQAEKKEKRKTQKGERRR